MHGARGCGALVRAAMRTDPPGTRGVDPVSPVCAQVEMSHARGLGLFSYPGEDLISDGLSHIAGAIHNI
eukprot:COSAG02_NODE_732_length_17973_cov_6.920275_1_plen_69_part_00